MPFVITLSLNENTYIHIYTKVKYKDYSVKKERGSLTVSGSLEIYFFNSTCTS